MGNVVAFKTKVSVKHSGNTLCRSGFHKWELVKEQQFDVKQGKLVSLFRCKHCAKIKIQAL